MNTRLRIIKIISRIALGLVWFYEGLVPKILFLRADEIGLVQSSHLVWRTPELTLQILGVAQTLAGLWLIIGLAERTAVFVATSWMLILIALVASGNPSMLIDPYGALVKDLCLIRMRNHGVDPRLDTVCSWLAQACNARAFRQENSRRRDQIAGNRIPPLRYIESELKDQPESEEFG